MRLTRRDLGILSAATAGAIMLPTGTRAADPTVSHGLSAFGDLKYPGDFTQFDYVNPEAPKGGLWSTAYGNISYDSFNPFILKGNPALGVSTIIFDSLMVASADEADSVYGLIAASAELAEDRSWVAFEMRPEARFHDGTPITAEDVVFSLETLRTKGAPTYRVLLEPVTDAVVDGPHRVTFNFAPDAAKRDLPMMVAGLPIFSKAYYDTRDFTESTLEPPLGNGAYKIGAFEPGAYVVFERVRDYWAADLPVNRGRHNFDQVRIEYFRDRSASFEAFKAGAFRFQEEFWSKFWATAYTPDNFPAVRRGEVVLDTIPDETPAGSQGFWYNTRREKLKDARVREAIGLCFDFEWSNKRLFYDLYKRTDSFFELGPMQAEGKPSHRVSWPSWKNSRTSCAPIGLLSEAALCPAHHGRVSGRNRRNLRKCRPSCWTLRAGRSSMASAQKDGEVR